MDLIISKLTKTYNNGVKALDNINLQTGAGMFGLLGPNGAGKSTLMRTIATLQRPDSGTIIFNGINVTEEQANLRKILGYLPQEFGVYPRMSAEELLLYFATLKGIASKTDRSRIVAEVLELTNLYDVRKKYVDGYSGGMKQRFGIAQLLLNNPRLIIVDEPTAGLDPAERNRFLNILREIGNSSTVVFSTHIVDDVKELCNDMAIMNGGRLLKQAAPSNAIKELEHQIWTKDIAREELAQFETAYTVLSSKYNADNSINIRVYARCEILQGFLKATPQLDDVYFHSLKNDEARLN
jgi:ABC-type multidrug transport system ATPase subunit